MEKYSWFTLDEKRVGKKLDYSAFKYNGTGVPKEFYNYFEIGDKDESIRFRCGDIEYNAEIKQDSYGRWQIRWDKTFTEILKEKFPEWKYLAPRSRLNSMRAIFAKTDHRNSYDISFIAEKNFSEDFNFISLIPEKLSCNILIWFCVLLILSSPKE